jgi:hypothetical protein
MIRFWLALAALTCIAGGFAFPEYTRLFAVLIGLWLLIEVVRSRFEK